jgi:hypothetical protein
MFRWACQVARVFSWFFKECGHWGVSLDTFVCWRYFANMRVLDRLSVNGPYRVRSFNITIILHT